MDYEYKIISISTGIRLSDNNTYYYAKQVKVTFSNGRETYSLFGDTSYLQRVCYHFQEIDLVENIMIALNLNNLKELNKNTTKFALKIENGEVVEARSKNGIVISKTNVFKKDTQLKFNLV